MNNLIFLSERLFDWVLILSLVTTGVVGLGIAVLQFLRFKNREEVSLNFVVLEILVPRGNEVKIDVAEQMFASLHSIKKGGWKQKFKAQQHLSFEIVGKKEEIRFYVSCHSFKPPKANDPILIPFYSFIFHPP